MSADNRAVEDAVFHIWIEGEVLEHALPDAVVAPAGEAVGDGVPVAILFIEYSYRGQCTDPGTICRLMGNGEWRGRLHLEATCQKIMYPNTTRSLILTLAT